MTLIETQQIMVSIIQQAFLVGVSVALLVGFFGKGS